MQKIITADYEQTIAEGLSLYLNKVERGTFLMGSQEEEVYDDEKHVRLVNINKAFYEINPHCSNKLSNQPTSKHTCQQPKQEMK